jgi:hypothetical protein
MPSEYVEMRNMGVGEARQILSQKIIRDIRLKNPDRDFTSKPITPEELEGGRQINYYDDESILEAQLLGKKTLGKPDFDFLGQYSPTNTESPLGDRILTRAYGEEKDPIDVSATMFHELLHKGHQKLVGIPTSRVEKDSKGNLKYVRTTPAEKQRARLLHLDVHRRTYEAYKDELSPDSLKDFVEDVYSTYGSKATIAYMKRFIKNLIESEREEIVKKEGSAPIMFSGSFMSLTYLPDDRARPVADAVFAEVAKLPPIRALNEELKTAYQKQRNSQGFIPKK